MVKGLGLASLREIMEHCRQLSTLVLNSCDLALVEDPDLKPPPVLGTLGEIILTSNTRSDESAF